MRPSLILLLAARVAVTLAPAQPSLRRLRPLRPRRSARIPHRCSLVCTAARRVLGSEVASIRQLGTYSCRRLYGRDSGNWSQHATAQAIDIAGFTLADGRSISLAGDWGADNDAGAFLLEIRNRGCGVFGTMLGPEYNAAHRDHFHLQASGYGTCR